MNLHIDLKNIRKVILKHFFHLLSDKNRFLILRGGAGSGKSVFAVQKFLLRILIGYKTNTIHDVLVIMKTKSSMQETIFKEFRKWIGYWNLTSITKVTTAPMVITFTNGSRIYFTGIDDPEKIKSATGFTSVFIEESSRILIGDFEEITNRIRGVISTYTQFVLAFNPVSKLNWIYRHFYSEASEYLRNNTTFHHSMVKNNYLLNDDAYKRQIESYKDYNINKYKTYWLGEWGSLEGVIYENYEIVDSFPDTFNDVVYGLDFGANVPSALIRIGEKDDEFYLQEVIYKTQMITSDIINKMKYLIPEEEKNATIYCDSAEPDRIEEIYRAGYYAEKAKKDVSAGIDFIKSKKLKIHKDSYNLIKEIEGYSWMEDKNGISMEKPCKFDDHLMDAGRYAMFTHFYDKRDYNLIVPT